MGSPCPVSGKSGGEECQQREERGQTERTTYEEGTGEREESVVERNPVLAPGVGRMIAAFDAKNSLHGKNK